MGTMTSIHLTSSNEIRRVLVAACVIFTLGIAGTVVGRAASSDEAKKVPSLAAAVEVPTVEVAAIEIDEPAVQLAAATIAPQITNETPVNGRELLHDPAAAARAEVTPLPAPAAVLPVAAVVALKPQLRTIEMEVTAYCPCKKCCGPLAQGITASGKRVSYNNGKFVAADTKVLPFGKKLLIPGYASGAPVEVIDRGGAIKGNKLDVYFDSHKEALKWGRQKLTVIVVD